MRLTWIWPFVWVLCLAGSAAADEAVYVRRGSSWKYLPGLAEASPSDPAAWRAAGFDDSSWSSGPAPFGYGDRPLGTDLALLDPPMRSSYTCLFLRKSFEISNADDVVRFTANVDYDDGFVLWINGTEVLRDNVEDPLTCDQVAARNREAGTFVSFDLPAPSPYLVTGENVVAVQAFNQSRSGTDFKIDVEILDPVGPDLAPPVAEAIAPAAGTTVRKLTQIEVTFNEEVTGVDAADLLVGGSPAAGLEGAGRGPYLFRFVQPPAGKVDVSWARGHKIRDLSRRPNDFPGGSWSYTLDPSAPLADLVISEFLAANRDGIKDEDGEASDWIEIHNRGAAPADLTGWALTDDPASPGKWTFPSAVLGAGEYLIVFASGKDRKPSGGQNLHASFKLSSEGEYLGLYSFESPREVASDFAPRYPEQRADISYGRKEEGGAGYFDPPTPLAPNGSSAALSGIASDPRVKPERGFYRDPLAVEIHTPTSGAGIYYTLDGSEPTATAGTPYAGPVAVAGTPRKGAVTLRAAAFKDGLLPSRAVTHTYIFPEHVLTQPSNPDGFPAQWGNLSTTAADYAMDARVVSARPAEALEGLTSLPALCLALSVDDFLGKTRGIYSNPELEGVAWERAASAELIRADGKPGFQVDCGLRVQGGTSTSNWKSLKLSLRLLFRRDHGPAKLKFPLFPDSAVGTFDDLVLDAHLNLTWNHPAHDQRVRSQYVRDTFVSDLQNATGSLAPHGIFVNLFIDGLYWGLYDFHERPDDSFASDHLGGDKDEYDVIRHNASTVVDGNAQAWSQMFAAARSGLSEASKYLGLMEYLDVLDLADYMIVNFYVGNDDWPHQNWYAARRRVPGAGFRFFSWDAEHVLKDVNINQTFVANAGSPAELYTLLRGSAEWRLLFADRVHEHFYRGCLYVDASSPAWDPEKPERNVPASLYMRRIDEIDPAILLESARWGDCRRPAQPYTRDAEWRAELNGLLNEYFPRRSQIVLNQLRAIGLYPKVAAPLFSHPGGPVAPGLALTLSIPDGAAGTIYFTTDGSDPRVFGSGDVSPSARAHVDPIVVSDTLRVKARTLAEDGWSALHEAAFVVSSPTDALHITEIMYHPEDGSEYEFLELHNAGAFTIDLSGLFFDEGIAFGFPRDSALGPGEYLVLASSGDAFRSKHPGVEPGGIFEGSLANGGEKITIKGPQNDIVLTVDYGDEGFWPLGPDGFGYSLVLANPEGDPGDPFNWKASARPGGSPGSEDSPASHGGVVVSEVLLRTKPPLERAIELLNTSNVSIDAGGWFLSNLRDDEASLKKFRIPAGTVAPAGGRVVLYENVFGADLPGFDAGDGRAAVYLAAADAAGELTGHIVGHEFEMPEESVSVGRIPKSTGLDFAPLRERTFGSDDPGTVDEFRRGGGAPNSPARVGPVVVHEIQYHPAPGEEEFVELHNITDSAIDMGGWRMSGVLDATGTADFEFPRPTEVPARGYILAVAMDPAAFRARYSVPAGAAVVGPYGGALDSGGETLKLLRPIPGEEARGGFSLVDKVAYDDEPPWPVEADGGGCSLERVRSGDHGNDPVNWAASLSAPGTPGLPNSASAAGVNQRPVASFTSAFQADPLLVLFDASAARDPDGAIARFEWDFGDGTTGAGQTALHAYPGGGIYSVTLRVADDKGAESTATSWVVLAEEVIEGWQVPGDGTQDGILDLVDVQRFLARLFLGSGEPLPCEGDLLPLSGNVLLLDVNADRRVDITDAIYTLNYLYVSGPMPALGTACIRIPGCPDACAP